MSSLPRPVTPAHSPRSGESPARALLDLVLPRECAGCGRPSRLLCPACVRPLEAEPSPRPAPAGSAGSAGLPPVVATASYTGAVRTALLEYKDRGRRGLALPLGRALARGVLRAVPDGPVVLVPVPSSAAAVRRRGDDVVRRLAGVAARELRRGGRAVVVCPALRLVRRVDDQAGLDVSARAANLAGAYAVRGGRRGGGLCAGRVVLVDDVVTSGATLAEAARALRGAGAAPFAAVTVAATARRVAPGARAAGHVRLRTPLHGRGGSD